ncbi:MAG: M42 family metallopeptidase [Erysipelotrichaceae bacterium]
MENKEYVLNLLQNLVNIDSPTGFTKRAINYLISETNKLGFSYKLTNKGNLIIKIEGKDSNARGLCAHVDTLGLMVRSIKDNGKLALTKIGGPCLNTLDGEYCKIYTKEDKVYQGTILSTSNSVHVFEDASTLARDIDHMEVRIDEKVKNKEDVAKLGISNGDYICIDPKCQIFDNGFIKSRFLDDKLSVAILFGVLKQIKDLNIVLDKTTYFIFTVYEEVGHGNSYIPSDIEELLGVDMGCIGLDLSCSEYDVSICAKDSSGPYDYDMVSKLITIAKKEKLNYAVDIYPMYGSDVSAALRSSNNIKGALIGPGVGASHGMERSHYDGVKATMDLILKYLEN